MATIDSTGLTGLTGFGITLTLIIHKENAHGTQATHEQVIGAAYEVHKTLGHGFLEKVYRNALQVELSLQGIQAQREVEIDVHYKRQIVGTYVADLLVENCLIVEIKAVQNLVKEHEVQLVNYLTATKIDDGLLLNFGSFSVQLKHKYRNYRPKP